MMEDLLTAGRPRRREYSKPFKAEILAKCAQPGATIGGVALSHGLHSNMVHRWIREASQAQANVVGQVRQPEFIPVSLPAPAQVHTPVVLPEATHMSSQSAPGPIPATVQVHLQRGELVVCIDCPLSQCAALLREVLR